MIFRRNEAKEWARENMRGIWAAALTPFTPGSLAIDEAAGILFVNPRLSGWQWVRGCRQCGQGPP